MLSEVYSPWSQPATCANKNARIPKKMQNCFVVFSIFNVKYRFFGRPEFWANLQLRTFTCITLHYWCYLHFMSCNAHAYVTYITLSALFWHLLKFQKHFRTYDSIECLCAVCKMLKMFFVCFMCVSHFTLARMGWNRSTLIWRHISLRSIVGNEFMLRGRRHKPWATKSWRLR